jgi:hypothetical protein
MTTRLAEKRGVLSLLIFQFLRAPRRIFDWSIVTKQNDACGYARESEVGIWPQFP